MNPKTSDQIQKIQLISNDNRTIIIIYEHDEYDIDTDGNNNLLVLRMTTFWSDITYKIKSNEYDDFVKKYIDEGYCIFCPNYP